MNKFIKNTFIFSTPLVICIILFEVLLRGIPNDYSYKRNYLDFHSKELNVLFLGSSHTYFGVNPKFIQSNCFNASHVGQSLDIDLEIFNRYVKKSDKLKYLFVPVDYFSLYNQIGVGVEKWRVKNYNLYYGINKSSRIEDYFEILNGKFKNNIFRIVKYYKYHKTDIACNNLGWGFKYSSKNNWDLISTGTVAARRHTKKNELFFKENIAILNKIVSIAKGKNIKVIFFTSPAYKTYVSQLNKCQLQTTISEVKMIASSNSNVSYFNFLNDKSFISEDFHDADHLNEIGAKKFSIKLDSIISSKK